MNYGKEKKSSRAFNLLCLKFNKKIIVMKLTAILTGLGIFLGKAFRIIKAVSKLKSLKKEIVEAYEESEKAYKQASETLKKIQNYFDADSDGGKKLTSKEISEAMKLLQSFNVQFKKATKEVFEAKAEISKVLEAIKQKR